MKPIKKIVASFIILSVLLLFTQDMFAQCPMCRITAESNLANGGMDGKGLNKGILFLLATPYFLIFFIAYKWWSNRKNEDDLEIGQGDS